MTFAAPKPLCILIACMSYNCQLAYGNHGDLPEVAVEYPPLPPTLLEGSGQQNRQPDAAQLLKRIAGAAVNKNGPLTSLVQYRGASGDRINVSIDGAQFVSGGPNKMDSPLSYIPGALLEKITVSRGIASVSKGQETLGGHVSAQSKHLRFNSSSDWQFQGRLNTLYSSNGDGQNSALILGASNEHHRVAVEASFDKGNNAEIGGGDTLPNSHYERGRFNLRYGYQDDNAGFEAMVGRNETEPTGTAALPMDIMYIDSDLASASGYYTFNSGTLKAKVSYADVEHSMDNFSQRPHPNMTMMMNGMSTTQPVRRATFATGKNLAWQISYLMDLADGSLELGIDNNETDHNAVVSNPDMGMFNIANFNKPSRDVLGAFVEWKVNEGPWIMELGLRHNQAKLDADEVSISGVMGMMAMNANSLAMAFNTSDRSRQHNNSDAVFKLGYLTGNDWSFYLGMSRKQRAPSYQEMYLWLPMQATGGLADGRSYIGNLELKSEDAKEINLTADWRPQNAYIAMQVFQRSVDNYIQGTSLTDTAAGVSPQLALAANRVSMMMNGKTALQFNNVDALLYGADIAYGWAINNTWQIDGTLSYVRGRRDDSVKDNLYRISPLNHRISLSYHGDNYQLSTEMISTDEQDKVSQVNDEQATAAYSVFNVRGQWQYSKQINLQLGVDNLGDKRYQDHLAGYNRVQNSPGVATGERLYGLGRTVYAGLSYQF